MLPGADVHDVSSNSGAMHIQLHIPSVTEVVFESQIRNW